MDALLFASHNAGKVAEMHQLLAPLGWTLTSLSDLDLPTPDEPYHSFVENALYKAQHGCRLSGLPTLADDSGLCVRALGGEPGVRSARFGQHLNPRPLTQAERNSWLQKRLADHTDHFAYYVCVLVFVLKPDDPEPLIAEGFWSGQISLEPAQPEHQGGFGYDPIFYLPTHGKTVAALDGTEKNRLSHRAQAVKSLRHQWPFKMQRAGLSPRLGKR